MPTVDLILNLQNHEVILFTKKVLCYSLGGGQKHYEDNDGGHICCKVAIIPQEAFEVYFVKCGLLQDCSQIHSVQEISIYCIYPHV